MILEKIIFYAFFSEHLKIFTFLFIHNSFLCNVTLHENLSTSISGHITKIELNINNLFCVNYFLPDTFSTPFSQNTKSIFFKMSLCKKYLLLMLIIYIINFITCNTPIHFSCIFNHHILFDKISQIYKNILPL